MRSPLGKILVENKLKHFAYRQIDLNKNLQTFILCPHRSNKYLQLLQKLWNFHVMIFLKCLTSYRRLIFQIEVRPHHEQSPSPWNVKVWCPATFDRNTTVPMQACTPTVNTRWTSSGSHNNVTDIEAQLFNHSKICYILSCLSLPLVMMTTSHLWWPLTCDDLSPMPHLGIKTLSDTVSTFWCEMHSSLTKIFQMTNLIMDV